MDRKLIFSILSDSWFSLEEKLKKTFGLFGSSASPLKDKIAYDKYSTIRKFGAEPYLQAMLFGEISKRQPNSDSFVLSVEGKELNGKRPDILGWNPKLGQGEPFFVIELKVTGYDLVRRKNKDGFLKTDAIRYLQSNVLENGRTLFFYGCYYESNPSDIDEIKVEYGSVLNWLIKAEKLNINPVVRDSIIEGYAFRGTNRWEVIDNSRVGSTH